MCALLETFHWCGVATSATSFSRFKSLFDNLNRRDPESPSSALAVINSTVDELCEVGIIERGRWGCSERFLEALLESTKLPRLNEFEKHMFSFVRLKQLVCACGNYSNPAYPATEMAVHGIQLGAIDHFGYGSAQDATSELQEAVNRWYKYWSSTHNFQTAVLDDPEVIEISEDDHQPTSSKSPLKTCDCGKHPTGRNYQILDCPKFLMVSFIDTDNSERTKFVRGTKIDIPSRLSVADKTYKLLARCFCTSPTGNHFWVRLLANRAPLHNCVISFDGQISITEPEKLAGTDFAMMGSNGPSALTSWLLYGEMN